MLPMPEPDDVETDDEYRVRLREWFDSVPGNDPPEMKATSWKHICDLQGITPGA